MKDSNCILTFEKIIIGLGNSGENFVDTRHNAGFMFIDALLEKHGMLARNNECYGSTRISKINDKAYMFVKPHTYMNNSGKCVEAILNKYQMEPKDIIVIYDDMDLELGKIKFKTSGGSGGHKGLQNIIDCLETKNISRIRIGIGRPNEKSEINDFLLDRFSQSERDELIKAIDTYSSLLF